MSARRALLRFVAVGIGLCTVSPAFAGPWSLKPGDYATSVSGSWQSSYHYLDDNGNETRLFGGGRFERRTAEWQTELGWKKNASVVIGIPFVSLTRMPGSGTALPATTVMGDALLGYKRILANGRNAAALEIDAVLPMGYHRRFDLTHADSVLATRPGGTFDWNVARQIATPLAGDGQPSIGGTLHLGTALGSAMFVSGYGGYAYRGPQWQAQILSGADLARWFGHSWLIGGRYRGVSAGKGDNPTRDASWMTVGPVVTYRVDDRIDVVASSSHTFSAKNALHADEVRFGFTFKTTKLNRLQGYLGSTQRP